MFNEIVSSNGFSLSEPRLGSPDWIEFFNSSDKEIDLLGYTLMNKTKTKTYTFSDTKIPAKGYLLVYAENNAGEVNAGICCASFGISKNGEDLFLLDRNSKVAARIEIPALQTDVSYARKENGEYGYCISTTPGKKNNDSSIYDKSQLDVVLKSGKIYISEVLPKNSSGYPWVEIYNLGDTNINLNNYSLTDEAGEPLKWRLPERVLKVGEYAVAYLSGLNQASPEIHASFKLGKEDTAIYLFDINSHLVSQMNWDKEIQDNISVLPGNQYSTAPTIGKANTSQKVSSAVPDKMDANDPVRLNEVLLKNEYSITDRDGQRQKWAELYNASGEAVSLNGYYLSDNQKNLFKWAFPADTTIGPKSYAIVFLSGKQSAKGELHASFKLAEDETALYLTNRNNLRYDTINIASKLGDNISTGPDTNGKMMYYAQPTPGSANVKGFETPESIGYFDINGVYISEVSAASKPRSGQNDWVELHNATGSDADLSGYYLSDDKNNNKKWKIPSLTIKAGGYAVIEAAAHAPKNKNIAGFGISPSGETLLLSDKDGNIIDTFDTGALQNGISSGRVETDNTVKRVFFSTPTRGAANDVKTLSGYTAKPAFSDNKLYHTQPIALAITCRTPGARIYYTLDGTTPTQKSQLYEGPVSLNKNTVVSAVAYSGGLISSEVNTATYLFNSTHTVPVVSISGDFSNLRGILRTDSKNGKEAPVNIEFFESDGSLGVSFPAGLRAKGRASLRFAQNSLTIALRSDYGAKSVTYPFFPDSKIKTFSTISLRNSGQDLPFARIRDSFFQRISDGMNVDNIDNRPVVVYINGDYYGIYDLNEEQNENYIYSYFGVESDNIDKISRNGTVLKGSNADYKKIIGMARSWNMADDKVFAEYAKYVDVDACTDYLIAQIYFGNGDVVNQKYWRARDYSVKWRPLLFDLDFCLRFNNEDRNTFRKYLTRNPSIGAGLTVNMHMFCALRENKAWREKFIERFVEVSQTQYKTQRILAIYDEMVNTLRPEMPRHIAKWHMPSGMKSWEYQVAKLRSAIEQRQGIVLKQLQSYFNVSNEKMQQLIQKYASKS